MKKLSKALVCFSMAVLTGAFTARAEVSEVAAGITEIPYTIKHSGIYVLRIDGVFKPATGAAITIDADHVTLDLGDHSLTNTPPASDQTMAVGINTSGHNHLTIRNGAVRAFHMGINLVSPNTTGEMLINNVLCESCSGQGFNLQGDSISVQNCVVRNTGGSTLQADGLITGIALIGNFGSVTGNQITNTVGNPANQATIGIIVEFEKACTVDGNFVANGTVTGRSTGIDTSFSLAAAFVTNNKITYFGTGLSMEDTAKYRDNLTIGCSTPFSGGTAVGTDNN